MRTAATICACLVIGMAVDRQTAFALSVAENARLQSGEPVVSVGIDAKVDVAHVRALVDIPAPAAHVWKIMTDCAHAKHFVPGLEVCRVMSRDPAGRWDIREHNINWAWFLPNIRTVIRTDYDAPKRLTYRMIEGTLRVSRGEWRLEPRDNGRVTRVIHSSTTGADVPVPNAMIVDAMTRDFTTIMQRLRQECLRPAQ